jgi:hypothetical protein
MPSLQLLFHFVNEVHLFPTLTRRFLPLFVVLLLSCTVHSPDDLALGSVIFVVFYCFKPPPKPRCSEKQCLSATRLFRLCVSFNLWYVAVSGSFISIVEAAFLSVVIVCIQHTVTYYNCTELRSLVPDFSVISDTYHTF